MQECAEAPGIGGDSRRMEPVSEDEHLDECTEILWTGNAVADKELGLSGRSENSKLA